MATSHGSKDDFPVEEMGDYKGAMGELPDGNIANFESIPAGMGGPDLFKGLPDDACQCPHWGYLFKGRFKATYTDGSEDVVSAGEAYYLRPGHVYEALEDVESIEFSPAEEWRKTTEQVGKNVEAMQGQ
jgi:hypothetical protein